MKISSHLPVARDRLSLARAASGPADVFQGAGSRREAAMEVLRDAGRPHPKRDLEWLSERFGDPPDLEDLARFYGLAQEMYAPDNPERNELIQTSLKSLRGFLDNGCVVETYQGGKLIQVEERVRMTRPERVDALARLLRAIPPEKPEHVLQVGDSVNVLCRLREILDQKKEDIPSMFHVGGGTFNERHVAFPPLEEPRPSMTRAVGDFLGYLHTITHAEGRRSPKLDWSDDHSAWSSVRIAYCALQREPEKVARFQRLLEVLQSPWHALAVESDLELVQPERRNDAEADLLSQVRSRRSQHGAPQNELETVDEGSWLNRASRVTCWSYALAGPGQPAEQTVGDATKTLEQIHGITSSLEDKAFMLCMQGRAPGESTAAVAADLKAFTRNLWNRGHSTEGAFRIFELLTRVPAFHDDKKSCIDAFLQLRDAAPEGADPLLIEETLHRSAGDLEQFAQTFKELSDKLYLTGRIDGMEKLRERVENDLRNGTLSGSSEELMRALELLVRLHRTTAPTGEQAVDEAYAELRQARCRRPAIRVEPRRVIIDGIALRRRELES
ncbi:MAG: hypothetical protein HY319_26020 [Armatimonadetes bacterium]|nr:hypothetical protein [Armatimonadota bacterium]